MIDSTSKPTCFCFWHALQLLDGSLRDLIYRTNEELDLVRVLTIAKDVAAGLAYLHPTVSPVRSGDVAGESWFLFCSVLIVLAQQAPGTLKTGCLSKMPVGYSSRHAGHAQGSEAWECAAGLEGHGQAL